MAVTLATMEQAILTALEGDQTLQNYCKTFKNYAGELEPEVSHIPCLFPAIFVLFLFGDYLPATNEEYYGTLTYGVAVATQTLHSTQGLRHNEQGEVGAYAMLADVRRALLSNTILVDEELDGAYHAMLVREEAIITRQGFAAYQAQYQFQNVLIQYRS